MIAHAPLAVIVSRAGERDSDGLIALTYNEIRRLFTALIIGPARAIACHGSQPQTRTRHACGWAAGHLL